MKRTTKYVAISVVTKTWTSATSLRVTVYGLVQLVSSRSRASQNDWVLGTQLLSLTLSCLRSTYPFIRDRLCLLHRFLGTGNVFQWSVAMKRHTYYTKDILIALVVDPLYVRAYETAVWDWNLSLEVYRAVIFIVMQFSFLLLRYSVQRVR